MNIPSSINQAKAAASSGNTKAALAILRQVIMQDPRNVDAWLVLADIVEKPEYRCWLTLSGLETEQALGASRYWVLS